MTTKITPDFFAPAYQVSADEFALFGRLLALFQEENDKINLSAIRTEREIWKKHFFDSLLAADALKKAEKIIDLGSGGGFPLLPLAIIFPKKTFYAVESVNKKAVAIKKFASELGLSNVHVLVKRAEELAQNRVYREQFDALTARAFAPFPVLMEIGLPFLRVGGTLIAFRGPQQTEEDLLLPVLLGGRMEKIEKKTLPQGDERALWLIEKVAPSEARFPRKTGVPNKKPLTPADF